MLIHKVIKRIINGGYLLSEYIRNYANYMHQKLISELSTKSIPMANLYYDKYTNTELDIIYKKVNDDLMLIN